MENKSSETCHTECQQRNIKLLVEAKRWQEIKLPTGNRALDQAIALESTSVALPILDGNYHLALRRAVHTRQKVIIPLLLPHITNINCCSKSHPKSSLLHYAAINGDGDILKVLLDAGAYVNMIDEEQNTALLLACKNGHSDAALLLAQRDALAVPNLSDESPRTCAENHPDFNDCSYFPIAQQNAKNKIALPPLPTAYQWLQAKPGRNTEVNFQPKQDSLDSKMEAIYKNNSQIHVISLEKIKELEQTSHEQLFGLYSQLLRLKPEGSISAYFTDNKATLTSVRNAAQYCVDMEKTFGIPCLARYSDINKQDYFIKSIGPVTAENTEKFDSKLFSLSQDNKLLIKRKNIELILKTDNTEALDNTHGFS